ncbi:Retrovirus-related Pol polyprotein from transposon TNT 1-94 [Dictyocoela muelleri]|nr:Retrovirus-related Pol polyprotein from transposon TNT 1-94 [Dictyocoela muelleri]
MTNTIRRYITCKNLKKLIAQITSECFICQKMKDYDNFTRPFGELIYSKKAFDLISTDILGPLKVKHFKSTVKYEYFYILTVTDIFSRFTKPYILFDRKSSSIISKLEKWIKEFGNPSKLLSDQGRQFISLETKNMMIKHKIKHIMIFPSNPRANGISEKINR